MNIAYEWQIDWETFGLAFFYTKGLNDPLAPEFLRVDSITIVIGMWTAQISWL